MNAAEWDALMARLGLGDLPWQSYSGPLEPVITVTMKASDWRALIAVVNAHANDEERLLKAIAKGTDTDDDEEAAP